MDQNSGKTVADIDLSKIDISKHSFILKAGEVLTRVIKGKYNPLIPTGQENRYAKNPNNVSPEKYQEEFWKGNAAICSTGNICTVRLWETAFKEVLSRNDGNLEKAVAYRLTILKDIYGIDTISICSSEGIDPTPKEEADFWHSFYGPPFKAQALRCRSAQDPDGENIIIFPDNIPDYFNVFSYEEYSKDETEAIIKQMNGNKNTYQCTSPNWWERAK